MAASANAANKVNGAKGIQALLVGATEACPRCQGSGRVAERRATGAILRRRRQAAGLTLRRVAAAMKLDPSYISDLENGRRDWRPELIERYLRAVGEVRS